MYENIHEKEEKMLCSWQNKIDEFNSDHFLMVFTPLYLIVPKGKAQTLAS